VADSTCKFCGDPIRWVDDDGNRLALNVSPVEGGSYRVVGAETARKVKKQLRSQFPRLYVPHKETCTRWEDVKAFAARQRADRAERTLIEKQLKHEAEVLPDNVTLMRNHRR
jgi:hypothetical protein